VVVLVWVGVEVGIVVPEGVGFWNAWAITGFPCGATSPVFRVVVGEVVEVFGAGGGDPPVELVWFCTAKFMF
jgi:hypothetical protein